MRPGWREGAPQRVRPGSPRRLGGKWSRWRVGEEVPRSTCFWRRRVGPGEEAALAGWRGGAPQRALPGSLSRPGIRGRAGGLARRCPAARDFGVAEPARKRSRAGGLARRCPAARASGVAESARKKFRKRSRWRDGEKLSCSACFRYGPGVETSEEGVLAGWREGAPQHAQASKNFNDTATWYAPPFSPCILSMCANRPVSRNDFITACEPSSLTSVDTLAFYGHRPRASLDSKPPRARK